MSDWTEERMNQQRYLAYSGRAGFWIPLEGGPRDGIRGFVPHLDWPFWVVVDFQGSVWSLAYPASLMRVAPSTKVVGSYVFDRQREVMVWHPADGAPIDIPSLRPWRSQK